MAEAESGYPVENGATVTATEATHAWRNSLREKLRHAAHITRDNWKVPFGTAIGVLAGGLSGSYIVGGNLGTIGGALLGGIVTGIGEARSRRNGQ